jgi:uncharacterized cupin superfamily protein
LPSAEPRLGAGDRFARSERIDTRDRLGDGWPANVVPARGAAATWGPEPPKRTRRGVRVLVAERRLKWMRIFNLHGDDWDRTEDREGWCSKAARVGQRIGAELIGGGVYELEAGDRLWPYHTHHANEEWLIVTQGSPTLRTPEGEQTLREGDVVCFPRGKKGAHQVINRTDTAIRVLMLSTLIAPDVVEYIDSGKIGARSIQDERIMLSRPGPTLDYWEGED